MENKNLYLIKQQINRKYSSVHKEISELQKLLLELNDQLKNNDNKVINEIVLNNRNQEKIKKALFYIQNMAEIKDEEEKTDKSDAYKEVIKDLNRNKKQIKDKVIKELSTLYKKGQEENNKHASIEEKNKIKKNLDALFMAIKNLKGIYYE